jgi:sodium/proline symporter
VVAVLAILLGLDPESFVFNIVSYAWAGFGATFGPLLLMALFWKRTTRQGALAGIIVGGLTVLIWKQVGLFGIYEIIPGFIFSILAIYVVSKMTPPPGDSVMKVFDETERRMEESRN